MHRIVTTTDIAVGRRRLALVAAVLAAGTAMLASCGDEDSGEPTTGIGGVTGVAAGGEPADPASDVTRPGADFDADVSVSADAVRVRYTFTNRTRAEVLVANLLPDDSGALGGAGLAYVTGAGDGIAISQRVFPQPDTDRMDWAQPPEVGATRVAPGDTVRAEVEVPRPLERRQPYGNDLGYGPIALPDPPADVRFCLGVLPSPYPVPVADQAGEAAPVLDHGQGNARAQYLFCSEPVELDRGAT